jgi:hypothetical protein
MLFKIMNDLNIYLMGDQPPTCPICGVRTEIIFEVLESPFTQFHICKAMDCRYNFLLEEDIDEEI